MRIAITGATGNLGTALLRRLSSSPEPYDVVGIARRPPVTPLPEAPAVQWVAADLTRDDSVSRLHRAFEGADAVVHLAWGFQPSHDLGYLEALGVGGTSRVVEAARLAGVGHLVHMSSVGAYAAKEDDRPVDETWPARGVPTSPYSRHKAAAEALLDGVEDSGVALVVCRLRPGIVGQRSAGSALLRYGVPVYVPRSLLRRLPVLPLDRALVVPMVHADDVAAAVEAAIRSRASGAFNLAAPTPVSAELIAETVGARLLHVHMGVLRPAVAAAWRVRLQQVDPGWLDLAMSVPLLDTSRARTELGWTASKDADQVLGETWDGIVGAAASGTPVLRPASVAGRLRDAVRRGPVASRHEP